MICNQCGKDNLTDFCKACWQRNKRRNRTPEEREVFNANRRKNRWKYKEHENEYSRNYVRKHKDRLVEYNRNWEKENIVYVKQRRKKYYRKRKLMALNMCGGAKCVNCGIEIIEALEFNCINGGHRKKIISGELKNGGGQLINQLISNKIDPKMFNIMCRVCNAYDYLNRKFGIKYEIKPVLISSF